MYLYFLLPRYQRPQQSWLTQFQELDLFLKGINPGMLLHLSREDDTLTKLLHHRQLNDKNIKLIMQALVKALYNHPVSQREAAKFVILTLLDSTDFLMDVEHQLQGNLEFDSAFIKAVLTVEAIVLNAFPKQHTVNVLSSLSLLVNKIINKRYSRNVELNSLNKDVCSRVESIAATVEDTLKKDSSKDASEFRTLHTIPPTLDLATQRDVQERASMLRGGYPSVDHYLDFLVRILHQINYK